MSKNIGKLRRWAGGAALVALASTGVAYASSHREAPFITEMPKVDGTDLYMFRSYEPGRGDYLTVLANYVPLQSPYGGPNYFSLDENAQYEIHFDNDGDGWSELTFRFRFDNEFRELAVDGAAGQGPAVMNAIPLINIGPVDEPADGNLNRIESYTISVLRPRQPGGHVTNVVDGTRGFLKPADYIGQKSFPDYEAYANQHIHDIAIPGCAETGRVFVGQRREGFYINVGEIFDLLNLNDTDPPASFTGLSRDGAQNVTDGSNITTLALELPISCVAVDDPVVGAWTTASVRQNRVIERAPNLNNPAKQNGRFVQVSRVGMPLVNEVVIGLPDKNLFNGVNPANDVRRFANYILYPTLPVLVDALFGVGVPQTPRNDLVQVFATGIPGLNQPMNVNPATLEGSGEMLRINTSIAPNADPELGNLGVLACDLAGFPNGRRPVDDVVDITLTVAEGALLENGGPLALQYCDTSGDAPAIANEDRVVTDGTIGNEEFFLAEFPYLAVPLPGSPNEADGQADD